MRGGEIMSWSITNHILKSGATKKFIVATSFPFDNPVSSDWTGFIGNRTNAGNAVYGWGNYFGGGDNDGTYGGQKVLEVMSNHGNNIYFTVNMNLWDLYNDNLFKRGSHTYCPEAASTNGKGHWARLPKSNMASDPSNVASHDEEFYNNYTYTVDYWWTGTNESQEYYTNLYGTSNWHTNWLSAITNGTNGTNFYDKMFAWYLMDEPYKISNANPGRRDCDTNKFSVQGHYDFCTAVEGGDPRPKMVDVIKGVRADINSNWNDMSNYITILCGNEYGLNYNPVRLWYTPNMAAWCYSKITNDSSKMAMSWLPGSLNTDNSFYVFYASIIEGARGVLWWMEGLGDHQNYTHQRAVYSGFTNQREFSPNVGPLSSDQDVILNGSEVPIIWQTNDNNGFSDPPGYPKMITKKFSALAMKHNNRYRLYVVNHTLSSTTFRVGINTNEISNSNWTNAWDKNGTSNSMAETYPAFPNVYFLTHSIVDYNIYDIGAGNQ